MIINSFDLDKDYIKTDIAIVGAGAAGITLALELERLNPKLSIILLEGGGKTKEDISQELYKGESVGWSSRNVDGDDLYYDRVRCIGGSTYAWGGQCRPFESIDFEKRDWVPYSGWPIKKTDLDKYYVIAQNYCLLSEPQYNLNIWNKIFNSKYLTVSNANIKKQNIINSYLFQWARQTRFYNIYSKKLSASENIKLIHYANLLAINLDSAKTNVDNIILKRSISGKRFHVEAKNFILAMGGIENPRHLLINNLQVSSGIGNESDLVGRFFQQHSYLQETELLLDKNLAKPHEYHFKFNYKADKFSLMLGLSDDAQRQNKSLGYSASLFHSNALTAFTRLKFAIVNGKYYSKRAYADFKHIVRDFGKFIKYFPFKNQKYKIYHGLEQAPNPDSRIYLSSKTDLLGLPQVVLDWRFNELDYHTYNIGNKYIKSYYENLGAKVISFKENIEKWSKVDGGAHHIGTTRMAESALNGVVDKNCKIFGVNNLYIAGSSVFPTSSFVNPTLTIVALAARLSEYLYDK